MFPTDPAVRDRAVLRLHDPVRGHGVQGAPRGARPQVPRADVRDVRHPQPHAHQGRGQQHPADPAALHVQWQSGGGWDQSRQDHEASHCSRSL